MGTGAKILLGETGELVGKILEVVEVRLQREFSGEITLDERLHLGELLGNGIDRVRFGSGQIGGADGCVQLAGLIAQIGVGIDAAGEHALPRYVDDVASVGRPIAVDCARQERLDARDLGATDGVEFGDLDDPDAAHLLGGILAADLGEFVGEPIGAGQDL